MFLKYSILVLLILNVASTEFNTTEEMYLIFFTQMKSVKKSIDILKVRVDLLSESLLQKYSDLEAKYFDVLTNYENKTKFFLNELITLKEITNCSSLKLEDQKNITKTCMALENLYNKILVGTRSINIPEMLPCIEDPKPKDCKAALKCSQKSGSYKIFIKLNDEDKEILVFCDAKTADGGWLSILRRIDGSVNFTRSWFDYANGFGNVDSEYWLGLDNIHELTYNNDRQELYVYIENWEGESRFASYDNFVVGGASDEYQLKSLGSYSGTAGDSLWYNLGDKFSTIDRDNDKWNEGSCADLYKTGWWFDRCAYTVPTGQYLENLELGDGMIWSEFGGLNYSHKIMYLMIRSW